MIARIALLVLLFMSMIYDQRKREVPMSLTVAGLVGSGFYAILNGLWTPVLLTAVLTLVSDFNHRAIRLAIAMISSVIASIVQPGGVLICATIFSVWVLWEFGILGGADAKLLMTAVLVLGNPAVLIPISIVGGIQGVIASLQKKKEIPFIVSIFFGTLLFVLYPYLSCFLGKV
jgi:Flp pilus assembly protein protease CpaA